MTYEFRRVFYEGQRWAVVVMDGRVKRIRRMNADNTSECVWREGDETTALFIAIAARSTGAA